jgi:sarcosine oxidase
MTRRTLIGSAALAAASASAQAPEPGAAFDVAVVGAGVFGAWTAHHLVQAGQSVVLIDAFGAGNARSSSGGESRVTRLSYGGDPLYSEMARASMKDWAALSARADLPVFHPVGVLWFSPADDTYMANSLAYLERTQTDHRRFDLAGLRTAYPQMRFRTGEAGFLETGSGALIAGRGVQTVVRQAALQVVTGRAGPPVRSAGGLVEVAGFRVRSAVYACGPWLPGIFPDLLAGRIVATRQEVLHFGAPAGDVRFRAPFLPVWADFNAGDLVYGFPDLEGQGFKMAFDAHGDAVDPDTLNRTVRPETIERARAYLGRRFPDLATAPLVHSRVCQYENTSNGDLLIDRHPGFERVWLVGGGSGHGFKHGPEVGRRAAAHVLDAGIAVEPRLSLATKSQVQKRTIY